MSMNEMTARERVLCALNHQEPDRIPVDFASTRSSGINALAYGNLLRHLQLPLENDVFDMKQLLADVDDQVRRLMGGDVIQLHRLAPSMGVKLNTGTREETLMDGTTARVPTGFAYETLEDGTDVIRDRDGAVAFKRPKGGLYFDDMTCPLKDAEDEADIDAGLSLPAIDAEELGWLAQQAKELHDNTPYAIIATTSVSLFERASKDFGFENNLMNLMAEPELMGYYFDKLTGAYLHMLDRYLDTVGPYIQILQVHDDYGTQNNTLISPDTFRTVLKPWHTKIHSFIKQKRPELKIFFHCCGSVAPLIPDLIESGIDILNPIQTSAAGMEPAALKQAYGSDLVFWGGGCNTQSTMTFEGPQAVREEAARMIQIFAPGGGFVFCQDHNIQSNVPPENIVALYKAAKELGHYPI